MDGKELIIAFGERLRVAREERGMSQRELSELVGLSNAMITKYEKRRNRPRFNELAENSTGVKRHPAWLMAWDAGTRQNEIAGLTEKQYDLFKRILTLSPDEYALFETAAQSILRLKDH